MPRARRAAVAEEGAIEATTQNPRTAAREQSKIEAIHKHTFVQYMMACACTTEVDAKNQLRAIMSVDNDSSYNQALSELNSDLKFCSYQLKTIKNPIDGDRYVGFINTRQDELAKSGTRLSHPQRDYLKALLEEIVSQPPDIQGLQSISEMSAVNLDYRPAIPEGQSEAGVNKTKLTKLDRQTALTDFCVNGWLARPDNVTRYYIGPRTYLELIDLLMDFDGVPEVVKQAWQENL